MISDRLMRSHTVELYIKNKTNDINSKIYPFPRRYWLNYWHVLISKVMSGFTSNTLLVRIQYCYPFKYFTDLIKVMRRMVK